MFPNRDRTRCRPSILPLEDRTAPSASIAPGEPTLPVLPPIFRAVGAGAGAAPVVRLFRQLESTPFREIQAFNPEFRGGVHVATGDVDGDTFSDVVVAAASGGPEVRIFSGKDGSLLREFLAFDPSFTGGVNLA